MRHKRGLGPGHKVKKYTIQETKFNVSTEKAMNDLYVRTGLALDQISPLRDKWN